MRVAYLPPASALVEGDYRVPNRRVTFPGNTFTKRSHSPFIHYTGNLEALLDKLSRIS